MNLIRNLKRNRRGFFFTIAAILLILPLLFLVSFYLGISEIPTQDSIVRVRCDELHYFVEDIKRDLDRAMAIFGRRSVVYATNYVVTTGIPLGDYEFTCTPLCPVDCGSFLYNNNGSEAAIAELVLCGTLYGENITYMVNHTMREWINRIITRAEELHFNTNITVNRIDVIPMDAWHFYIGIDSLISISDESGLCYYSERIIKTSANTSILGLEDPLYTLNTEGHVFKQIVQCNPNLRLNNTAGCSKSNLGSGEFSGTVIFYSDFTGLSDLEDYCNETPQEILGHQILVLDQSGGINCNKNLRQCFNISSPKHFGGLIAYQGPNTYTNCNPTIPFVADTGEMDNESPYGGGNRDPDCDDAFITNSTCVLIINDPTCDLHRVFIGYDSLDLNTTCYYVSNISRYNTTNCTENYSNGPSFFDRLDGNLNLSEKYVRQAREYFNTEDIGIETLINLEQLDTYNKIYPSIKVYPNATWVDYLYWQNISGCRVSGSCVVSGYSFNLDCPHTYELDIGTNCNPINGSYCP